MLLLYAWLIGLCAGGLAGTLAGLAGIGGGLIYVPLFYLILQQQQSGMAVAVFASMVAVVATAWFSARSHWHLGHVDKNALYLLVPGLVVGASLGLWSTLLLPAVWLLLGLAVLNAWVAIDYGKQVKHQKNIKYIPALFALPIGYIAGIFGVAGGTMLVPLLRRRLDLKHAVGTSATSGLLMVALSLLCNVLWEHSWRDLLYQYWPVLLAIWSGIFLVVPFTSRWAAWLHQRLSEEKLCMILKMIFAVIALVYMMLVWDKLGG